MLSPIKAPISCLQMTTCHIISFVLPECAACRQLRRANVEEVADATITFRFSSLSELDLRSSALAVSDTLYYSCSLRLQHS